MAYPRINDDWIFRETFDSVSSATENGADTIVATFNGNQTVTLNGTTQHLTYGTSKDLLRFTATEMTAMAWITTGAISGEVIANFSQSSPFQGFSFSVKGGGATNGKMSLYVADTGDGVAWVQDTGAAINDSTRTHVAVTFDGSNGRFYTNGVLSSTIARSAGIGTSDNLMSIGRDTNAAPSRYFNGTLEDVRLYNRMLSAAELLDIVEGDTFTEIDDSKALLALPLRSTYDDGGTTATENIGSLGGTVDVTQLTPRGMNFPGTNNTLIIGTSAAYPSGASARTVFLILDTTEITGQTRFGGWGSSGSFGEFSFGVDTNTTTLELSRYGGDFTLSGSNLPNGGIHSVAYAYDGTDVKGYVDGIKSGSDSTQALDTNNAGGAQTPSIGSRSGGTVDEFIGDMYVVLIYDFELTPTQIKYLHNKYMRLLNK